MVRLACVIAVTLLWAQRGTAATVRFEKEAVQLKIYAKDDLLARYVFDDPKIPRPYFCDVHVPGGAQVTRNHPPVPGKDATDHDTFHPGIWLAFGDLGGADFWRNKGRVEVCFIAGPQVEGSRGWFAVRNKYMDGDREVCIEDCAYSVELLPQGWELRQESRFTGARAFAFGDQEEMGLGIRVATPLAVKNGGQMRNSEGLENEKAIWGKTAAWCDYTGTIDGEKVGMLVMTDPSNFRSSWMHARDYGFLAANPFGQQAFTNGAKSLINVSPGDALTLGYGIYIHRGLDFDPQAAYRDYCKQSLAEKRGAGPRRNWDLPCPEENAGAGDLP
jgi:hypothetical protein